VDRKASINIINRCKTKRRNHILTIPSIMCKKIKTYRRVTARRVALVENVNDDRKMCTELHLEAMHHQDVL